MEILPNVHLVDGVIANPYLIVDDDGLTIIDAGLPTSHRKILAYIARLGKSPADLKRIILTHSDLDHVGGLAALQRATGARTYASKIEAEAIARGEPSRKAEPPGFSLRRLVFRLLGPIVRPRPFHVDELLADAQVLPVLGGLRVVDTAGHTPGHVSLFAPEAGVLFCGDSMRTSESAINPGTHPGITWDAARARESIRKQAALGARVVCAGHGPVVMDARGKFPLS